MARSAEQCLCQAYPVTRGGETKTIPVEECTDQELNTHADMYDTIAEGLREHARAIRDYVETRNIGDNPLNSSLVEDALLYAIQCLEDEIDATPCKTVKSTKLVNKRAALKELLINLGDCNKRSIPK